MDFKYRLRSLRTEKNISGEKLGSILGVGKSTVSMWENGNNLPTTSMLERIAEYFSVSVDYLLGKSDIKKLDDIEDKEFRIAFYGDYQELDKSQKELIRNMIKTLKEANKR